MATQPGPVVRQAVAADVGLFLLRAALAAVFMYHGSQKLFGWFGGAGLGGTAEGMGKLGIPYPVASATVLAVTEFFGGLVLLLGSGTRLAAIPMAFAMLVAIVKAHPNAFDTRKGGMEFPLTLLAALLALALIGPGRITIGALLGRRRVRPNNLPANDLPGFSERRPADPPATSR